MTSPLHAPEPCWACGAIECREDPRRGIIDAIRHCDTCELPVCESCSDADADCSGDPPEYHGWVTCKACPPGAVAELDRQRAEHSREPTS